MAQTEASPSLKMWDGQQVELVEGVWRRSPQRGPGASGQGVKVPEAESLWQKWDGPDVHPLTTTLNVERSTISV